MSSFYKYRIGCFIDSLNSGGAQRQLCLLAKLLKQNGYDVIVYVYKKIDFYKYIIDEVNIPVRYITPKSKVKRITELARNINKDRVKILIAYLKTPVLIAELASLLTKNCTLVVSERSYDSNFSKISYKHIHKYPYIRFLFHTLANAIITNSKVQADYIKSKAPWLQKKIYNIHNCVDLQAFQPKNSNSISRHSINLLMLGRYEWEKNPINLLKALVIVNNFHPEINLNIDWYGNNFVVDGKTSQKSELFFKLQNSINENNLQGSFRLHLPTKNVLELYQNSTALILPSFYEGCSNVICEAMACGKPVLASNVGDNPIFVKDGHNGYLFNPHNPQDIANKILTFSFLKEYQRESMGYLSREIAEEIFSPHVFTQQYINIIENIVKPHNL